MEQKSFQEAADILHDQAAQLEEILQTSKVLNSETLATEDVAILQQFASITLAQYIHLKRTMALLFQQLPSDANIQVTIMQEALVESYDQPPFDTDFFSRES